MRAAITFLALPLLAAANVLPRGGGGGGYQCNTGSLKCCDHVGDVKTLSQEYPSLVSLLTATIPIDAIVGVDCSPLSAVSITSNSCSAQPACCTDNKVNGLVNVQCVPVNLNL
ncbi:Fruiting body protein SC4 [Psilocybe cubensis]|uniref:Fruiting body protein SC4 n=2 Tax=Psilocybe cubensis TaxID=181762 RepID=A0ACB8GSU8_PSICU|nr:Fruiting body protein SC4 [Psilocybe cubensis]KAH9478603.1 Fruiting body protein SC4 [Psilocybe cubensis]